MFVDNKQVKTVKKAVVEEETEKSVSLVSDKRRFQMEIVLTTLKVSHIKLAGALLECDEDTLTTRRLNSLMSMMPTPMELEMVEEYAGDKGKLGNVEQFINTLLSKGLKGVEARVKSILFKSNYKSELEVIQNVITHFKDFFTLINTCPKLKMVSTYALAYGNYMNGQSNRGANFGFGLSDLLAACSITSDDGTTNLLAYIIQ